MEFDLPKRGAADGNSPWSSKFKKSNSKIENDADTESNLSGEGELSMESERGVATGRPGGLNTTNMGNVSVNIAKGVVPNQTLLDSRVQQQPKKIGVIHNFAFGNGVGDASQDISVDADVEASQFLTKNEASMLKKTRTPVKGNTTRGDLNFTMRTMKK
jgi:hypothetical protein